MVFGLDEFCALCICYFCKKMIQKVISQISCLDPFQTHRSGVFGSGAPAPTFHRPALVILTQGPKNLCTHDQN